MVEFAVDGHAGKLVYIAHPLGQGDNRDHNRKRAAEWVAYLAKRFRIVPSCAWIVLSGVWDETPELRKLGLELDVLAVNYCHELWMVGGRISDGMKIEAVHALSMGVLVRDLTWLGTDAPGEGGYTDKTWALTSPVKQITRVAT